MRGWHNEPMRHALAARGIKTRYLYHGTASGRISDIKRVGLRHDLEDRSWGWSENYVYFTTSERDAFGWGFDAVDALKYAYSDPETGELLPGAPDRVRKSTSMVLRVKIEDLLSLGAIDSDPYKRYPISQDYNMDVISPVDIPPEIIEVKTVSGWRPLT